MVFPSLYRLRLFNMKSNKFHPSMVVIDTREQLRYGYHEAESKCLPTGDYSIRGYEDRIAIERKELGDFLNCVGRERKRFERELQRLADLEFGAVVIEASLTNITQGNGYSKVHPQSAVMSIIGWTLKYKIPFFLCDNRRNARKLVYHLLRKFWEYDHGA